MYRRKLTILLAEDNEDDAALIFQAISRVDPDARVTIVENGVEVIRYLEGAGRFSDREKYPFPKVLITDIKMPQMDGFDVLTWLADHPDCSIIPTIVLSTSDLPSDVDKAYRLGANTYFRKPQDFQHLVKLIELNLNYWVEAQMPT